MSESYVQEPAEVYGDQIPVDHRIDFQFTPIANKAIEAMQLIGKDAFITYCVLMKYVNQGRGDGQCWPTLASLMYYTTFGRNRVIRSLKVLREHCMVESTQMRKGREFGANRYTLTDPSEWTFTIKDGVPELSMPKNCAPKVVTQIRSTSSTRSILQPEEEHTQNARACEANVTEMADEPPRHYGSIEDGGERWWCPRHDTRDACDCRDRDGYAVTKQPGDDGKDYHPIMDQRLSTDYRYTVGVGTEDTQDTMDTLQPVATSPAVSREQVPPGEACRAYQGGIGVHCEHEWEALGIITDVIWPNSFKRPRRPVKAHPLLHAFIHESLETFREDVRTVAVWWRANRKPKDWTIPLMFSRPGEVMATAQSGQTPAHDPTDLSRYDKPRTYETARPVPLEEQKPPSAEDVAAVKDMVGGLMQKMNADAVTEARRTRGDTKKEDGV